MEGDENVLLLKERWGDVWIRAYRLAGGRLHTAVGGGTVGLRHRRLNAQALHCSALHVRDASTSLEGA